jgi:hypothetical protein
MTNDEEYAIALNAFKVMTKEEQVIALRAFARSIIPAGHWWSVEEEFSKACAGVVKQQTRQS